MANRNNHALSLAVAVMMTGGTFCYGQSNTGENLGERQAPAQPQGGAAVDRADSARPAAARATAIMADPKQFDQQADQELTKIEQTKDGMAGDRAFVLEAGLGGHFEVAAARQALEKTQDPQVKRVAQTIIQDHEQADAKLMPVAQKLQVDVPMGLTSMKQHKLNILGSMDSKAYDQAYLACMDEAHAHDVHAFRNKSQLAKSPDVKRFAAETLPKLQEHQDLIQQSAAAMGMPTGMEAQPAAAKLLVTPQSDQGTVPANPSDGTQRNPSPAAPENRPNAGRPPSAANVPSQPK